MAGALAIAWSMIRNVTSGRILGRISSGTGRAEELTPTQVRSLCSVYSTSEVDAIAAAKVSAASLALGTTGSDLNWSGTTLNVPDAGAAARGVVTTGTQTFAGNKTFSGDISMQKATQGYIRAYGTGGVNNIAMYDDNTNGIVSTSSGALVLSSATSIIGIGGITSAYPAIKRSSTTAAFRLGDDSADAPISCAGITASGVIKTNYPSLTTPAVQVETTGGAEWGMGYYSGNLIFYTGATLGAVLTATEMRLKSTMKFSWSSATDNLAGADVTLSRSGSRIVASGGVTATAGSLNSGGTVQNSAVGVCDLVSAAANPCSVVFSENGVANRGSFGFAAGSSTLSYRAGGTSMTTGTEVFTIGNTGNVTCAGITASGDLNVSKATASAVVNSTDLSSYSAVQFSEAGVAKAYITYINSAFSTAVRQGYIEVYNSAGGFSVWTNSIKRLDINTAGLSTFSGAVSHGAYTVATLPSAASNAGKMAQVTDSSVAASGNYGATVAAGGANRVKVFSDGINWVIA